MRCIDEILPAAALARPVRIYAKDPAIGPAPVVLHLHGGAFVGGSLESGRTVATLLAQAGAVVASLDYPLAPEHRFPQALEAAFCALNCLHANRAKWAGKKSRIFVAGEEAGGNLAAGLALMARDRQAPPLAGQILLCPMLDPCLATCSIREADAGAIGCKWADGWNNYLGSPDKAAHPYASPLGSSRLAGVAPALVLTAEDDPMRDEGLTYARRLIDAGVVVREHVLTCRTGWPDSLDCLVCREEAAAQPWAAAARDCFSTFFAELCPSRSPSSAAGTPPSIQN
jgi:acetyl esterase